MNSRMEKIRNFSIVAHIDHGKSTLADRLLEKTNTIAKRDMESQILDSMDLERERGITIKLTPTKMNYIKNGVNYTLNLIDTPGHVDFAYEVSRSLAACEGALLIVDATQGVEAQTLANCYLALDNNLEILPVINKIDLPSADVDRTRKEIEDVIGIDASLAPAISAKDGTNIEKVLDMIIDSVPPPKGDEMAPLKALIFDSSYDNFKGAICIVRIFDGIVKVGTKIQMMKTKKVFEVTEVGYFSPQMQTCEILKAGEVGYICASIKNVSETKVGDTITEFENPATEALPGYKDATPVVFSGIFLVDGSKYNDLKENFLGKFKQIEGADTPRTWIKDIKSNKKIYYKENKSSLKDFLIIIYKIRCNIFHGDKPPMDSNIKIIAWAYDCLNELLNACDYWNS